MPRQFSYYSDLSFGPIYFSEKIEVFKNNECHMFENGSCLKNLKKINALNNTIPHFVISLHGMFD